MSDDQAVVHATVAADRQAPVALDHSSAPSRQKQEPGRCEAHYRPERGPGVRWRVIRSCLLLHVWETSSNRAPRARQAVAAVQAASRYSCTTRASLGGTYRAADRTPAPKLC